MEPNDLDQTPEPVPSDQKPVGNPQPVVDWEARYKGLQRTYDKLSKDYESLKGKYDQQQEEHEGALQESRKKLIEYDEFKKTFQALENDKSNLEKELASHRAQVDRTKTIMAKFSDLAPFEAQGLLPEAPTIEELETKLEAFRKAIGDSVDKTALDKLRGYTPPSSGNNNPPAAQTKESVYAELTRLSGRRTPEQQARYEELLQIWDDFYK